MPTLRRILALVPTVGADSPSLRDQRELLGAHVKASQLGGPACGHARHIGTCPACQRLQLARWQAQLAEARKLALVAR
jgi:hypothetical protein